MMVRNPFRFKLLRRLCGDSSGVTLVEFAIVGPVLVVMIIGLFDMAHSQYTSSVLQGALQKAGRDLTIQSRRANTATIDDFLSSQVRAVMPNNATITMTPQSFYDFSDVNKAEQLTRDTNNNGNCDAGDTYIDANNNNGWDAKGGKAGIGGARDVILYTATVTYPRLFPMAGLIGLPSNVTLRGSTVLRTQPFDVQTGRGTSVRTC
ncbi:dihydrolipoamide acetyltransferase [Porphyrobacter sp. TH134]|uniref:TadE/TadG family type IV pilus assembly protein n=1 Tax=Porphyrobacter sp. TH134 TaxID=2067450 RepID=UPI000C7CC7DD|nr:TadE/TadG family type IV pilus assembly protein [Porphyrobacter sp. TH134]PLK25076.1 dihydrolipoamide acetyltransferase [Porphyrobacter sp. TH134]